MTARSKTDDCRSQCLLLWPTLREINLEVPKGYAGEGLGASIPVCLGLGPGEAAREGAEEGREGEAPNDLLPPSWVFPFEAPRPLNIPQLGAASNTCTSERHFRHKLMQ